MWKTLQPVIVKKNCPKSNLQIQLNPIKSPTQFFTEIFKVILNFIQKHKNNQDSQNNPEQSKNCWRNHHSWFKLHYRVTVIQKQYGTDLKNNHIDQWNRIKDLDTSPCIHSHLIFDRGQRHTLQKRQHLKQMVLVKLNSYVQKNETRSLSLKLTKTQL